MDRTQFSQFVWTHIADPAAAENANLRFQSSAKSAANMGIANMRAGRSMNILPSQILFRWLQLENKILGNKSLLSYRT